LPDVTRVTINNSSNIITFGNQCFFFSYPLNQAIDIIFTNGSTLRTSAALTFSKSSKATFPLMSNGSTLTINNYTQTLSFSETYTSDGDKTITNTPAGEPALPTDPGTSNVSTNIVDPFLDEPYTPKTLGKVTLTVNYNSGTINTLGGSSYPCFKEGSKILTNRGYVPIEKLRKGDLIKTVMNDYKAIDMIGKRDIYHPNQQERIKAQLYKCSQDKYPEVFEDLILTGCHCILIDDFTSDKQRQQTLDVNGDIYVTGNKYRLPACVDSRTTVYDKPGTYTIYHLALENDYYFKNYGIYANGLLVETCSKRYMKELSGMTLIE